MKAWYRGITAEQWRALVAAKLGWVLDAMDFLLYVMALGHLKAYFDFGDATAGLLGTITLLVSAFGGLLFGLIADRFGRARALTWTILIFFALFARRCHFADADPAALLAAPARHWHGR